MKAAAERLCSRETERSPPHVYLRVLQAPFFRTQPRTIWCSAGLRLTTQTAVADSSRHFAMPLTKTSLLSCLSIILTPGPGGAFTPGPRADDRPTLGIPKPARRQPHTLAKAPL